MPIPYWIKQKNKESEYKNKESEEIEREDVYLTKFLPSSLVSKAREKIISYSVGIADRTLSLQYRQFKAQIENTKKLNLENTKTYNLSDAEIQKYLDAVKKINGKELYVNIKDVNIDLGGFSLEVAKELGADYLRGNVILISTKQRECDSLRIYASFTECLIKKLFDENKNMGQILLGEAVIGRITHIDTRSSIMNTIARSPESIFNIEMVFDTPLDAMSKLRKIKEDEKILIKNTERLKDRKFLGNLLCSIEEIISKHGPLDRIPDKELIIEKKVDYYKLNLQSIDIYCLRAKNGLPIFVYFDSNNIMKENYIRDDYIILNGQNPDSINVLIDLEIIGYSPYIGLERAIDMMIIQRKNNLRTFMENNPESSNEVRKLFLEELMKKEEIPEKAEVLLQDIISLVDHKKDKNFLYNLGTNKIYMVYPIVPNEILYEILNRFDLST